VTFLLRCESPLTPWNKEECKWEKGGLNGGEKNEKADSPGKGGDLSGGGKDEVTTSRPSLEECNYVRDNRSRTAATREGTSCQMWVGGSGGGGASRRERGLYPKQDGGGGSVRYPLVTWRIKTGVGSPRGGKNRKEPFLRECRRGGRSTGFLFLFLRVVENHRKTRKIGGRPLS